MSSFKSFSAAQSVQGNEKPADTSKVAPAVVGPVAQPEKAPSEVKDASKT